MSGEILEFRTKPKSAQNEGSSAIPRQPKEILTCRVIDAVKYYILVEPNQASAMAIVKYLTTTPLGPVTVVPPALVELVEKADRKKLMIVEMGGTVDDG